MLKEFVARTSSTAAVLISSSLRQRYKPAVISPDAAAVAAKLNEEYSAAVAEGFRITRQLILNSKIDKESAKVTLTIAEVSHNLRQVETRFNECAAVGDPDAIAAKLLDLFCLGIAHMDNLDNRRRVAATWSALLGPSVVMRHHANQPIALDSLVDSAADWVEHGYTNDAMLSYANRKTRFICDHPARMYQLIADAAQAANLGHKDLICAMLHPVILPIGYHVGCLRAVEGHNVE